jgi:hypothetical protein
VVAVVTRKRDCRRALTVTSRREFGRGDRI